MEKILVILKLLPALIAAIKAIEEAIPGQGHGEAKLAAIRESLELADETAKSIWPTVAGVVGVLVNAFNKTKTFAKV